MSRSTHPHNEFIARDTPPREKIEGIFLTGPAYGKPS